MIEDDIRLFAVKINIFHSLHYKLKCCIIGLGCVVVVFLEIYLFTVGVYSMCV